MEDNADALRKLLDDFRVVDSPYLPEDQAPPVDWDRLRALVRRELPTDEAMRVAELAAAFRSWAEAYGVVLKEGFREWTAGRARGRFESPHKGVDVRPGPTGFADEAGIPDGLSEYESEEAPPWTDEDEEFGEEEEMELLVGVGRLGTDGSEKPPVGRVSYREFEVPAVACEWWTGDPSLAGGRPAKVIIEWSEPGYLDVSVDGFLSLGLDATLEVVWRSAVGDVRAQGITVDDYRPVHLEPADRQPPREGDRLHLRHLQRPEGDEQGGWDLSLTVTF